MTEEHLKITDLPYCKPVKEWLAEHAETAINVIIVLLEMKIRLQRNMRS